MKKTMYAVVIASVALLSCKKEENTGSNLPKEVVEVRIKTLRNCNTLEYMEIKTSETNAINFIPIQENFGKDCINYISIPFERNKQFVLNVNDKDGFYAGHHLNTNTTQPYIEVTLD